MFTNKLCSCAVQCSVLAIYCILLFMEKQKSVCKQAVTEAASKLGYTVLKPEQLEIVTTLLRGRDVFAVLPTGFGKSLCDACLPAAFDKVLEEEKGTSIVVVVTPLLAIIHDQVDIQTQLNYISLARAVQPG